MARVTEALVLVLRRDFGPSVTAVARTMASVRGSVGVSLMGRLWFNAMAMDQTMDSVRLVLRLGS